MLYNVSMEDFLTFLSDYGLYILIAAIVVFVIAGVFVANFSYDNFLVVFEKAQKTISSFSGSALDLAAFLSERKFNQQIRIKVFEKNELVSNGSYAPAEKCVYISKDLAFSNSIASISIIMHEFGHVCQHAQTPKVLQRNFMLTKVVKVLGLLNYPFFITGLVMLFLGLFQVSLVCFVLIVLDFVVALILKFLTIKIEKDASKRAIQLLKSINVLNNNEIAEVKKVLKAAKSTYIGDFFRALFSWTGLTRKTKLF